MTERCDQHRRWQWLGLGLALLLPLGCDGTQPRDDSPPVASITVPAIGATFRGGDTIVFIGQGTDMEDGALDPSRLTWWAELHHDDHTHPFLPATAGTDSGSVTIPTIGETSDNVFYRFYLVAVDAEGNADTVTRDVQPLKVSLSIVSQPAGLQITIDGQPRTSPVNIIGVAGMQRELGVVTPQTLGDSTYAFSTWSDGGAESHPVSTPDTNVVYVATLTTTASGNQPPSVTLTAPQSGSTVFQDSAVAVSASATDPDGTVVAVEFFDGLTSLGTDSTIPFGQTWTPGQTGPHVLTVRATDDGGAVTTSAAVNVTVTTPGLDIEAPVASLIAPVDQSQNLTGAVVLAATASDNVGVAGVQFQVDGQDQGSEDTSAPYSVTLTATSVYTTGQHVIRARARDAAGNFSPWAVSAVTFGGNVNLPQGFVRSTLVPNLPSLATTMAFAPDGRLFICLQNGDLRVVKNGALLATPFVTVPTTANGERGLLGIAFHPNFSVNGWVYLYYTSAAGGQHNRISRFTASGDTATTGESVLVDLPNLSSATNHNGGALHFGQDGKLYVAVGDNATSSNAPSFSIVFGKVLRFNDDGSIPSDNPFFNSTTGLNRSIWARGLRNPYTFGVQPGTGRIFINDVGEGTWEEVNEGVAGSNYGWPATEGPTTNPSYRSPIFAYQHNSGFVQGNAIVGSAFYNPATVSFPSGYVGSYFFADYVGGWIHRLDPNAGNGVSIFARMPGAQTDLQVGPDGALYSLSQIGGGWGVYRISFGP